LVFVGKFKKKCHSPKMASSISFCDKYPPGPNNVSLGCMVMGNRLNHKNLRQI